MHQRLDILVLQGFNNNLYVLYVNASGVTQYGKFNGSGITLIPNPDASTVGFYNDYSVVFNNKIISRYVTADGTKQLAYYNGTHGQFFLIPIIQHQGLHRFSLLLIIISFTGFISAQPTSTSF